MNTAAGPSCLLLRHPDLVPEDADELRLDGRLLGSWWQVRVEITRLEEHQTGARWWAWVEGYVSRGGVDVVGTRIGPIGEPSRAAAIRSAFLEMLGQLRDCAWQMTAIVVLDAAVPTFIDCDG